MAASLHINSATAWLQLRSRRGRKGGGGTSLGCSHLSQPFQSRNLSHVTDHPIGDQTDRIPHVSFIARPFFLHAKIITHGAAQCLSDIASTFQEQHAEEFFGWA